MGETEGSICDWIALSLVTGVGSRTGAALIDRFGSPTACFKAGVRDLEAAGIRKSSIAVMKGEEARTRARRDLSAVRRLGGAVTVLGDPNYPSLLRETYDPPIVIYHRGELDSALSQPAVAIVGSRRCSAYGRNVAEMLSRDLASRGVTIVSGLARGIDSVAHRAALDAGGLTVAVLGTGLNTVYPTENRDLAESIAKQGALLTEFPLSTPPLSQNFPFRNRVISGLTLGVLVVEGAERSGSLITARMAYEQGRDVFAVPGNITSRGSFGPNHLIKDGAKLVHTWRDVVDEFPLELRRPILEAERDSVPQRQQTFDEIELTVEERSVLARLKTDEEIHIDTLLISSGLEPPILMGALLRLEMLDRIRQLPGKCFVKRL